MSRYGDSRLPTAPSWQFSSDTRPLVGTNPVYQGKEFAAQVEARCPADGSPGPKYYPTRQVTASGSNDAKGRTFGGTFVLIDKRISPGPARYEKATAPNLGAQKIDSTTPSMPLWGFGASSRDTRDRLHLSKHDTANLPSRMLVGNPHLELRKPTAGAATTKPLLIGSASPTKFAAAAAAAPKAEPDRTQLSRAMAVAMTADASTVGNDAMLTAAMRTLHSRVAALDKQRTTRH